jgi:lactoylglutathione lyase
MADGNPDRGESLNHAGICVSDLERSRRFYQDVLGFRSWYDLEVPDEVVAKLLQLTPPLGTTAAYLVLGRFVLELIHFAEADARPVPPRVMNDLGLTHLSIAVADIPASLEKVTPYGGEVLEDTDIGGFGVMIRDPDGQLLELTTFRFPDSRPPWPGD